MVERDDDERLDGAAVSGTSAALADVAARVEGLAARLEEGAVAPKLASLRSLEEEWARRLLGSGPLNTGERIDMDVRDEVERGVALAALKEALPHVRRAEQWQRRLVHLAGGGEEDSESMFEVRSLQVAAAWLLAGIAQHGGPDALDSSAQAHALAREVHEDRQLLLEQSVQALLERLEGSGLPGGEPREDPVEAAFRREVADLAQKRAGETYWDSVFGLRSVEELWARHLVGVDASADDLTREVQHRVQQGLDRARLEQAIIHLGRAEEWQSQIGSCATGSGEGLASMAQVRALQASRAWLHGGIARQLGAQGEAASAEARRLISEVRADPNKMGRWEEPALRDLEAFLDWRRNETPSAIAAAGS